MPDERPSIAPSRVYTVPSGLPFLVTLARAVFDGQLPEPDGKPRGALELSDITLILPTRRSAKGLREAAIAWRHAVPNAILPVVTLAGIQFGHLLGGSILIETVFGWPGLGRLVFDALLQRDTNVLLGILFVSSVVVVLANLLVDLLYGFLDPRIVHR